MFYISAKETKWCLCRCLRIGISFFLTYFQTLVIGLRVSHCKKTTVLPISIGNTVTTFCFLIPEYFWIYVGFFSATFSTKALSFPFPFSLTFEMKTVAFIFKNCSNKIRSFHSFGRHRLKVFFTLENGVLNQEPNGEAENKVFTSGYLCTKYTFLLRFLLEFIFSLLEIVLSLIDFYQLEM